MELQQKLSKKNLSDFVLEAQNLKEIEKENKLLKVKQNLKKEWSSPSSFDLRQFEQKQILLTALTRLLFEKFEEMHPTKKFSKFELVDISWYKK